MIPAQLLEHSAQLAGVAEAVELGAPRGSEQLAHRARQLLAAAAAGDDVVEKAQQGVRVVTPVLGADAPGRGQLHQLDLKA
jgi:hypothetical protein